MSIKYLKNAVVIGPAKEAALYFDVVVPFDLTSAMTQRAVDHAIGSQKKPEKILKSLLPIINDSMSFYRGYTGISNAFWGIVGLMKTFEKNGSCDRYFEQQKEFLSSVERDVKLTFDEDIYKIARDIETGIYNFSFHRDKVKRMLNSGIDSLGIDLFSIWHDPYYEKIPNEGEVVDEQKTEDVSLVLQDIDYVDAEKLSWKKIIEIRRDKKALAELRDLRNFLHKDLSGLEREAALDIINSDIERYKKQVKIWGLDTVKKSLSMVVSKEGIGLTAMGALASFALTGVPVDPVTAISTVFTAAKSGAALNLTGNAVLQFVDAKIERKKVDLSPESHVRYLRRLRKA